MVKSGLEKKYVLWDSTCPFSHCHQLKIFNRFLFLGRENVDRVIREICASSRKWTPVLENHQRILSRGINLEFDTYMKGILLPQDYNEIVRLAIRRLTPRKNSRKSSTSSTLSVPRSINWWKTSALLKRLQKFAPSSSWFWHLIEDM